MDERQDDERTPLIAIVRVEPPRQRYPHHRLRKCCNFIICLMLISAILAFLFPFVFNLTIHATEWATGRSLHQYLPWSTIYPPDWPRSQGISYEHVRDILLTSPKEEKAKEWSKYYTSGPHLAGKNLSQALWTRERWQEFGIPDTSIVSYDVYLNYPISHRLALYEDTSNSSSKRADQQSSSWKVKVEASLEEDVLEEDSTTGLKDRIPTFHGYSKSGNVTAPYVYVNYGTYEDFDDLVKAGIHLEGKIAIVKYGRIFRGLKVKRAGQLGMVGMVVYSDPGDDQGMTEESGEKAYPAGKARNPSSVQRGSTEALRPGDPTTPGYPSKPGVPRTDPGDILPSIPSIPMSYKDAIPFLKALNGHGPKADSFGDYWKSGGLSSKGVKYNVGPSPDNLLLNLVNEQEYVTTPLWNVIGVINGSVADEVIILGNHRDAWVAGGAGDPNSGSAALNEVIRAFGIALKNGWKPLRTIVFASWDGEEYGLIGSTEWVEEYIPWLSAAAIAYLNVDIGTVGSSFIAHANPLVDSLLEDALKLVQSPNQTIMGQSVYDVWDKKISTLGSGSDFTAFQDFAGIPSFDIGFTQGKTDAVYHYHSNYDSFYWMDTYGDHGWHHHVAMAKIWAMAALNLVDRPIIPFSVTKYAQGIESYVDKASAQLSDVGEESDEHFKSASHAIKHLAHSAKALLKDASDFDRKALELMEQLQEDIPWWKWWEKVKLYMEVRRVNTQYKYFDRTFLYEKGLDGRPLFKHTIFAPDFWRGYAGQTLPGLVESIGAQDWKNVTRWSKIINKQVKAAAASLK